MDIHKPKAAHNWREFAVEIGTIICGILIALGLEQAVDASRTHHEVTETREALKQEVASNAARDLASAAEARCELFGLDRYIEWAKGGVRPPVRPPFSPVVSAAVWEASRSSAVLHMPVKERLQFARYYDLVEVRRENVRMVANLALDRERLSRLHRLDAEQSKRLQEYASAARDRLPNLILVDLRGVEGAIALGVKPTKVPEDWRRTVEATCAAFGAPPPSFDVASGDFPSVGQ